ncbi:MAG: hypothetical protein ACRDYA_10870 [Egibacteraceae bacterium]
MSLRYCAVPYCCERGLGQGSERAGRAVTLVRAVVSPATSANDTGVGVFGQGADRRQRWLYHPDLRLAGG